MWCCFYDKSRTTKLYLTLLKIPLNSHKNRNHPLNWPSHTPAPAEPASPSILPLIQLPRSVGLGHIHSSHSAQTPALRSPVEWLFPTLWRVSQPFRPQRRYPCLYKLSTRERTHPCPGRCHLLYPRDFHIPLASPDLSAKLQIHYFQCHWSLEVFKKYTHSFCLSSPWQSPLKKQTKNKPKQNKQTKTSATMSHCLDLHLTSRSGVPSKRSDLKNHSCILSAALAHLPLMRLPSNPINLTMFQIWRLISILARCSLMLEGLSSGARQA